MKPSEKSIFYSVSKPPPIPNKKKKSINKNSEDKENIDQLNMMEETQDIDNTVASIHLNESDLKELDDEFTFDEGDDEVEEGDDVGMEHRINKNNERKKSISNEIIHNDKTSIKLSEAYMKFNISYKNKSSSDLLVSTIQNLKFYVIKFELFY